MVDSKRKKRAKFEYDLNPQPEEQYVAQEQYVVQ
jgi:hypothetical protein